MLLNTLISCLCLSAGPFSFDQSLEIVHERHLETKEGRVAFLTGDLSQFLLRVDTLNNEIQGISNEISSVSGSAAVEPSEAKKLPDLVEQLKQKMSQMTEMLAILEKAHKIDADLQQIDEILHKQAPLEENEKETVIRIATLCDLVKAE